MKSHTTPAHRRPRKHRGFTLLELLIVITIIGVLAALTLGAFRFAQESAARNRTVSAHATIRVGLEQYKEKWGEYPEPANPAEQDSFTGHTLNTGAAHMLYQAITGDGNSAIRLQSMPAGGVSESDGQVAEIERENALGSTELPKSMLSPANAPSGTIMPRLLVDGWNRPFQYVKAVPVDPTAPAAPTPTTVNSTYDLWSFGPMSNPSMMVGDVLEERRDQTRTASWIKNW
jgi:prepilin-type N-terminal cleavage/methylation domain-containing protein